MTDKILALTALVFFVGFLAIIASYVPEPDLIIVISLGSAMAIIDLWLALFKGKKKSD